jgi:folate-binding Fe-S cluster repair protein YgfZ
MMLRSRHRAAERLVEEANARAQAERSRADVERERAQAADLEWVTAEAERNAAWEELNLWTAGGPLARAWRAFRERRGGHNRGGSP